MRGAPRVSSSPGSFCSHPCISRVFEAKCCVSTPFLPVAFLSSVKTVRFSEVVEKSGRPEPYTLWLDPESDADFQRALKHSRIMSVHQETVGSKADYGEIGYT